MTDCSLCSPELAPQFAFSPFWRLSLNRNQNLLGKCFLVLRRHEEVVARLTPDEWLDLHSMLAAATVALRQRFQPDHFNYAFLQNQDRHVHLHIIPRYAAPRTFAGLTFDDPDYPAHYAVPSPPRFLPPQTMDALAASLRDAFPP